VAADTLPPYPLAELTADPRREELALLLAAGAASEAVAQSLNRLLARQPLAPVDRMLYAEALHHHGNAADAEPALAAVADESGSLGARAAVLLSARLFNRGEFTRAIELAEKAERAAPTSMVCQIALGNVREYAGRTEEAVAHFRRALTIQPGSQVVIGHLATALIAQGKLQEGLKTWLTVDYMVGAYAEAALCPVWEGEPLGTDRILLLTAFGFGDRIQFLRFAQQLRAREPAARICVLIAPQLAALAADSGLFDAVYDQAVARDSFDWQITQTHLPLVLGLSIQDVLCREPYLRIPAQQMADAAAWLPPQRVGRLRVGLRWAGRPLDFDAKRSIPLALLQPLFEVPGIDWVSLSESDAIPPDLPLLDMRAHLTDFRATGALMRNLDLIISVDTSVVHLAGALNLPVWLLARPDPEWRWGRSGTDNPWYGSVRVFRHRQGFDWPAVVSDVAAALRERVAAS
jgi:tetratricopeptide (TPR) repeat protein